tara:strand:- start:152 stop:1285 length:1134 start_codon:yes stop_codon:yes gene_type:complete
MSPNASKEVSKVLDSGFIGEGEKVKQFEKQLKNFVNTSHLITTNSATSALHLALHLLKNNTYGKKTYNWPLIQEGDEVLTTPLTCTATNWPILANRLDIKWVDIDTKSCNMCLDDLKHKLSEKTKIIMLVHWGGNVIDLDRLREIQNYCENKYGFKPVIIEDAAHALGSEYKEKKLGNTGHQNFVIHSFQAIKHLTTIDGGCLILPDSKLTKRARLLRWYGIDREDNRKDFRCENNIKEWGYKFHMNDICATVGLENIKHVKELLKINKDNSKYYDKHLKNHPQVELLKIKSNVESANWLYTIKVQSQDKFMKKMKKCGIMVSRVHERNDTHSCVDKFSTHLPNLNKLTQQMICIPNGWWVSPEEIKKIVSCIKDGW